MKKKTLLMVVTFSLIGITAFTSVQAVNKADFNWQPPSPTDLDTIHFIDNSSGDIIVWVWYFGDGNSSIQQNPMHKYADNGVYNVRLIVVYSNGTTAYVEKQVNVANVPPIAVINISSIVNKRSVSFSSGSYDNDGNIIFWSWEFGDNSTGTGENINHVYTEDGIYLVNLTVYDNDGAHNESKISLMVDSIPPETVYNVSCEGWCNKTVNIEFNSTDNLSGVNYTEYKIDDGSWNKYTEPFQLTSEGIHVIYFYSVDNAGNVENEKNVTIKIDKTKPITNAKINASHGNKGWILGNAEITLIATDNLSGVNYTEYKIDDGSWNKYTEPFQLTSEGIHVIYFYSVDNAGNVENEKNVTIKIDKTKPDVNIKIPKEGYLYISGRQMMPTLFRKTIIIGKLDAVAEASDSLSGVYYVEFILNSQLLWKDFVSPYNATLPQEFPVSFGNSLKVVVYDNAGNYKESNEIRYTKIM
ncbi:MAG: PKD domain-containing protein [Thermoplasmata archaeon]|nr:PKD domain-containing protein [Thermoplasmata archaeon]